MLTGLAKFVLFVRLKNSARNISSWPSLYGRPNVFEIARSVLTNPGPVRILIPDSPTVPIVAVSQAAVLNDSLSFSP